jgi:cytochrome bd-type quinol oxidase subunit 2
MTNAPQPSDPLDHLEDIDRRESNKLAVQLAVGFPIAIILTWVILHFTLGESVVTQVLPILVAVAGLATAATMVLSKWRHYKRWQPFVGLLWWLIPIFLLTSFTLLPALILD